MKEEPLKHLVTVIRALSPERIRYQAGSYEKKFTNAMLNIADNLNAIGDYKNALTEGQIVYLDKLLYKYRRQIPESVQKSWNWLNLVPGKYKPAKK